MSSPSLSTQLSSLPIHFTAENSDSYSLSGELVDFLLSKAELANQFSKTQRAELLSLRQEKDPQLLFQSLISLASRLEASNKIEPAALLYSLVSSAGNVPTPENSNVTFSQKAQKRLSAFQGEGNFGARFEFLLKKFAAESTDGKIIFPMMAGTTIYALGRTAVLGRLAINSNGAWYAKGMAARLLSSTAGFALEVPTFTLASRGMRRLGGSDPRRQPGLSDELMGATSTLGLLKVAGFAGNQAFLKFHGINELGAASRLAGLTKFTQPLANQSSMFFGLLAAHKLEEKRLGLEPAEMGTVITDTLASMASLGVGAHLGSKVLGRNYARLHAELGIRADIYTKFAEAKLQEKRHPLLSPWLSPAMMMLGAGGLGGGEGGSQKKSPAKKVALPKPIKIEIDRLVQERYLEDINFLYTTIIPTEKALKQGQNRLRRNLTQQAASILEASLNHHTTNQVGYPLSSKDKSQLSESLRQSSRERVAGIGRLDELTFLAKLGELGAVEILAKQAIYKPEAVRRLGQLAKDLGSRNSEFLRWGEDPEQPLPIQSRVAAFRALQKLDSELAQKPKNTKPDKFEHLNPYNEGVREMLLSETAGMQAVLVGMGGLGGGGPKEKPKAKSASIEELEKEDTQKETGVSEVWADQATKSHWWRNAKIGLSIEREFKAADKIGKFEDGNRWNRANPGPEGQFDLAALQLRGNFDSGGPQPPMKVAPRRRFYRLGAASDHERLTRMDRPSPLQYREAIRDQLSRLAKAGEEDWQSARALATELQAKIYEQNNPEKFSQELAGENLYYILHLQKQGYPAGEVSTLLKALDRSLRGEIDMKEVRDQWAELLRHKPVSPSQD